MIWLRQSWIYIGNHIITLASQVHNVRSTHNSKLKVPSPKYKHPLKKGEPPTRVLPLSLLCKEIHPLLRFGKDKRFRAPPYNPQAFEKA